MTRRLCARALYPDLPCVKSTFLLLKAIFDGPIPLYLISNIFYLVQSLILQVWFGQRSALVQRIFSSFLSNIWCAHPSSPYKQCLFFRSVSISTCILWPTMRPSFFTFFFVQSLSILLYIVANHPHMHIWYRFLPADKLLLPDIQ